MKNINKNEKGSSIIELVVVLVVALVVVVLMVVAGRMK